MWKIENGFWILTSVFCPLTSVLWSYRYRCDDLGRYEHPGHQGRVEHCSKVNSAGQLIKPGLNRYQQDQHSDDVKQVLGKSNKKAARTDKGNDAGNKEG